MTMFKKKKKKNPDFGDERIKPQPIRSIRAIYIVIY